MIVLLSLACSQPAELSEVSTNGVLTPNNAVTIEVEVLSGDVDTMEVHQEWTDSSDPVVLLYLTQGTDRGWFGTLEHEAVRQAEPLNIPPGETQPIQLQLTARGPLTNLGPYMDFEIVVGCDVVEEALIEGVCEIP